MLTTGSRVRPLGAEIAAKVIDGEAIIINLTNGMYYSMDQAGALIWELISRGRSLEEMSAALTSHYDVSISQARADAERVVVDLLEEKLVRLASAEEAVAEELPPAPARRLAYETPVLNKYSDLGDLLALDPPMPGLDDIPWQGSAEESTR